MKFQKFSINNLRFYKKHRVHITCNIRINKNMKFHKTAVNKLCLKENKTNKQKKTTTLSTCNVRTIKNMKFHVPAVNKLCLKKKKTRNVRINKSMKFHTVA